MQTQTTSATQQRIITKPTLSNVIDNHRCVTVIRLAMASQVSRDTLLAVMQDNSATQQIAERIARGLTKLTEHRVSVLDIEIAIHP